MKTTIAQRVTTEMFNKVFVKFAETTGTPSFAKNSKCYAKIAAAGIPLHSVVIKTAAKMRYKSEGYQCLLFVQAPSI